MIPASNVFELIVLGPFKLLQSIFTLLIKQRLFPVTLMPKYQCSGEGGWHCQDVGNSALWIMGITILLSMGIAYFIKKPRKTPLKVAKFVVAIYIGFWIGIVLYLLLTTTYPAPSYSSYYLR